MNTDDLIDRLSRDVTVTKPLPTPGMRSVAWAAWAVSYVAVVAAMMSTVVSPYGVMPTPLSLVPQAAALFTGIIAARAAFASVIPGAKDGVWVMPALGATVWVLSLGELDLYALGALRVTGETDWPCVISMTLGGLVVGAPLVWMLRRGAPLTPHLTAFLAALAVLSFANIEACLTRPHAVALTVLVWHGGTITILAALCTLMVRRWLRWPDMRTG